MASVAFIHRVRDSANTTTDNRKSGLNPAIGAGKTLGAAGNPPTAVLAGAVTWAEVGWGVYAFYYDAELNGDASFPIDWGAALANPNDRYADLLLTRDSGRVLGALAPDGALLSVGQGTGQVMVAAGVVASNAIETNGHAIPSVIGGVTVPVGLLPVAVFSELGNPLELSDGMAQGGTTGTITLSPSASAVPNFYVGWAIEAVSGAGQGTNQPTTITAYNASTKVATLATAGTVPYDASTAYDLTPPVPTTGGGGGGAAGVAQTGDAFALLNPMIVGHAFTTAALANGPAPGGGSGGTSYTPQQISSVVTPAVVQAMSSSPVGSVAGAVASVTAPVTVGTNNDKAGYILASSGLDSIQVEVGVNARQALAPILAACGGLVAGAGSGAVTIKGGNSPTTRITATTDASGNRTSVTLALPA